MRARFLPILLIFCGFTDTSADAKPRTVQDVVIAVGEGGEFTLRDTGPAVLTSIVVVKQEAMEQRLASLKSVEVKSLGQDRYGRARVLLYRPGFKTSVQEELLGQGAVLAYDRALIPKAWLKAEAPARDILSPTQAAEHIGEFRTVEGTVTRTYKSRDMWYLNFGSDWKTDFSLRIPKRSWRSFGKNFAVADGARLRARGAIFLDNGPMIELTRPEQLEILSRGSNSARVAEGEPRA